MTSTPKSTHSADPPSKEARCAASSEWPGPTIWLIVGASQTKPKSQGDAALWWTWRRLLFAVLPLLVLAAMYAVATIDIRNHDGRVLRGVQLGQTNVGGMDSNGLDDELDRINSFVETAPVYIETPGALYQIDAERLGLTLDRGATRAAVLTAGREGSGILRPLGWLQGLFSKHKVNAVLRLDTAAAEAGLAAVSKTISVQPGEPTLQLRNGRLVLEPGEPGTILDVNRLLEDLSASLPSEAGQEIFVNAVTTTDAVIDVEIQSLIDRINGAQQRLELVVGDQSILVPQSDFRSWVELDLTGESPRAELNAETMFRWINAAAGIAEGEIDTRALIVEGNQIRLPVPNARMCCTAETSELVFESVLAGASTIEVALLDDDLGPLAELGISELIGEFTTEHEEAQDRVINIQRMADVVRGALIQPGETFSLNDYVGERTTAKGFVPAGVIYDGVFTEDVGGGVSQFATTLFNASFFGGLDFVRYQAHSIYIDRYPYGREATVSWPDVDLRVRNPTEFPILIWTEYSPGTITVKLFGTATVSGEQTGQEEEPLDECTKVRTERTRTWVDGSTEIDYVSAVYQPEEGLGCDGKPTTPPPECDEDEGLVDTDDNGFGDLCVPLTAICPAETVAIDENDDGLIDYCFAESCPENTEAVDTTGDGQIDQCIERQPIGSETDDPEPDNPDTPDPDAGDPDTEDPDEGDPDNGDPDARDPGGE